MTSSIVLGPNKISSTPIRFWPRTCSAMAFAFFFSRAAWAFTHAHMCDLVFLVWPTMVIIHIIRVCIYIYISKIYIKNYIYIYSIYDSPTAGLTVTVSTFTPHFGPDWWDDVFVPFGPASSGPLERCANFFSGSSHDTHFPCFKYIEKDVNHTQRPYK